MEYLGTSYAQLATVVKFIPEDIFVSPRRFQKIFGVIVFGLPDDFFEDPRGREEGAVD